MKTKLTPLFKVKDYIRPSRGKKDYEIWAVKCHCGKVFNTNHRKVLRNEILSCGCGREKSLYKHGMSKSTEFKIWYGMIERCTLSSNPRYKDYGGRGINVCKRWLKSFTNFYKDMGSRPNKKHTLDRIDNNKGYSKSNCRWATQSQQMRNTRVNKYLKYDGQKKCITEWAEITGINRKTLVSRLYQSKMSIKDALTTPVKRR